MALTEKQLQKAVISTAKQLGWKVSHFGSTVKVVKRGDRYATVPDPGASGFPDLVLVRPPRLMFVELKGKTGQLSEAQMEWMAALSAVAKAQPEVLDWQGAPAATEEDSRIDVYVWRPNDWESGVIGRRLK